MSCYRIRVGFYPGRGKIYSVKLVTRLERPLQKGEEERKDN